MINRERIGTEMELMTGRIRKRFLNGKDSLSNVSTAVGDRARTAVRRTDYYVHDNAWKMLGIAAGLAFAAGFIISSRNQEAIAAAVDSNTPETEEKVRRLNSWEFLHSALPLALFFWKAVQASRCARKGAI